MSDVQDKLDIADVLYRFAAGLDEKDAELFASVWAEDAVHDFSRGAAALGLEFAPVHGRDAIVSTFMPALEPHTTTHSIGNIRVTLDGDTAKAVTLTDAIHLTKPDHAHRIFAKNRYEVDLRRDAGGWVITKLVIDNVWWEGEIGVLSGAL
jgi:3-phenylpropionate/cinnamic acid dioxygenase small subunit